MRLLFAACLLTVSAFGQTAGLTVDVYVSERDNSAILLGTSKPMVADIFHKIGVTIRWHSGEIRHGQTGIAIRTSGRAPESATPEALAASHLDGGSREIVLYEDRVRLFLNAHRGLSAVATGYVFAHELAHAMQDVPGHSSSGILKAHWSGDDFQAMVLHKLAFTREDVQSIRLGLAGLTTPLSPVLVPR